MSLRIVRIVTPSMAKYVATAFAAVIGLWGYHGATSAQQQGAPARGSVRQACASDYHALCPGVQPGGGHIMACFRQHAAQLSTGCKEALAAAKAARQKPPSGS